jgi:hypothetical protein
MPDIVRFLNDLDPVVVIIPILIWCVYAAIRARVY